VINRNRLDRGFKQLITWLLRIGMKNVIVVDNGSTYMPLIRYYAEMAKQITILKQDSNIGPRGFWQIKKYHETITTPYIVTDCDLAPAPDCPDDVIEKMLDALNKTEPVTENGGRKVGVSLRIDNLPDHFCKKQMVLTWEKQFWNEANRVPDVNAFYASVDTTFAMYHPKQDFTYTGMRLDKPYSFEHIPWYVNESIPNEEDDFYKNNYETLHEGGKLWKSNTGGWSLYGWSVRSKESLEDTFRLRGIK
jgi:hypothetical protein